VLFDAWVSPQFAQQWFDKHSNYDNVIFSEQGWIHRSDASMGTMARFAQLNCSFWDSYRTVLLIRHPITRYLSHLRMNYNNDYNFLWKHARDDSNKLLRQNFLTQHLVPGFRHNHGVKACSNEVLNYAKRVIDKYDLVLEINDAVSILTRQQTDSDRRLNYRQHNHHLTLESIPTKELRDFLLSENDCDMQLWQYFTRLKGTRRWESP
jgi:hypothetical protein